MKTLLLIAALCVSVNWLVPPALADVTGRPHDLSLTNPKGHCINCHDLHQTKLGQGYAHNLKRANEIAVCYQCHAGALNDYSSIDPSLANTTSLASHYDILSEFNQPHQHFPRYGMDGEHNKCSFCHNPHGVFNHQSTTRKPKLLSAGPDAVADTDEYCFVCHNSDANPPHRKFSNISVGTQYKFSRNTYKQMTHSTFFRGDTVTEPVPDTARTYDDNPYGTGKDISCLTCHKPHGSPNDHMLKSADNQDFCLSCHDGSKAADLTRFRATGHGKTGVGRTCQDCHFPHGTGQENAVKKIIVDPHTLKNMTANVNGKGMNEACFACHKSAGTAKYYTGKSDYSTGIHDTSPNAHNPGDTSNDYLPGECDNCHDPHGRGYAKMAVDQDQVLCYDCHNSVTHNTQSGKDVEAAFQQMSSSHDLTKVKCINCHNVHKATQAAYLMNPYSTAATVGDKKVFCLSCHSGRMPAGVTGAPNINAEWAGNGHDKSHVLTCDDCHESHGSPNRKNLNYTPKSSNGQTAGFRRGLSFSSRAFCESCHNRTGLGYKNAKMIPTGSGYTAQHDQSDTTPCSNCHNQKHNPTISYTAACLDCHKAGTGNPYPNTDTDFNSPAVPGGLKTYTSTHQITYNPPLTVDCVKCHGANHATDHRPTNKITDPDLTDNGGIVENMSSIRISNKFCMECHDATPVSIGGKTAPGVYASMLPNGSLENSALDSWVPYGSGLTAARATNLAYLGTASVMLRNVQQTCWDDWEYYNYDCTEAGYLNSQAFFNVSPSTTYTYSGYVDVPSAFSWGNTSLVVTEYTAAGAYVTQHYSSGVSVTSGWQKITDSWTTNTATGKVVLGIALTGPGTAYWDDLESSASPSGHDTASVLLCYDCHEYHKSYNKKLIRYTPKAFGGYTASFAPGKNFSTRGFCESCHNRAGTGFKGAKKIPTGAGYMAQHDQSDTTPCNTCHTDKHNPTIQASYYTTSCLDCHKAGSGNPYPNADAQFNTPGVGNDANTMGSVHKIRYSPPGTVDCAICHGASHETDHSPTSLIVDPDPAHPATESLDIRATSAFCLQCHDSTPVSFGGAYPPNIMDTYTAAGHGKSSITGVICYDCHEYHGSPNKKLIKTAVRGLPVMSIYSGDNVNVCIACHRTTDKNIPMWPGYAAYSGSIHAFGNRSTKNLVKYGLHGYGTCVNCHNPHGVRLGGKTTRGMAYKNEEDLCYNCHNGTTPNTASGDDVQARFRMASHHGISDADQLGPDGIAGTADDSKVECSDCHDPHIITEKLMAFKEMSDTGGRRVVPEAADQKFCIKCHSANPPAGVKYPAAGVWNKYNYISSAHGNRLFRKSVFGMYTSGIPCKVCHNPHGSNQAHLQRDSWDINRDGIPDDIDGDGILDSSTQVGFIGYSTGTRKVKLVAKKGTIPSRASFQRVSTTIPKQANGSIDVEICLVCHDGTPAYNVRTDVSKRSHHPVEYSQQVALGGAKIYCYSCHDQHRAQATDEANHRYATTNPECNADNPLSNREPMEGDAAFCLKCHDNVPPAGISFGSLTGAHRLKNIKLSYNPSNHLNSHGYDVITTNIGHFVQSTGKAMMCRDCHNQHGSDYDRMLRDNTEPSKPGYDSAQPVQNMQPVALSQSDPYSGGDSLPLSSTAERCLACHSGVTTYKGSAIPLPPPPDSGARGFPMQSVEKHPDMKASVTSSDLSPDGQHIYKSTFALVTSPGSVKAQCTMCHDSHNPYIKTLDGELVDCYRCHNQNTSLPDVQSQFNDNPMNPAYSQTIHPIKYDPTDKASTSVECLKCHDQSKHMMGRVRLRKLPNQFINYTSDAAVWTSPVANRTINQFCLECHGPGTTAASSFWRGGTEHVPPKLPAGYADGAHYVNGNLLCTDCHEYHGSKNKGLKKNALTGEAEAFCYNCHNNPAKSMNGINMKARFSPLSTVSHHTIGAAEQAANGSKVTCTNCHNPHSVSRPAPVTSPADKATAVPADDAFCIGCHGSTGVPGVKFPGYTTGAAAPEWDMNTGKWNQWNKGDFENTLHKGQGITCEKCHDPHGTRNMALLLRNVSTSSNISVRFGIHSTSRGGKRKEEVGINNLCKACHKGPLGVFDGFANFTVHSFSRKNGIDKNCTYCHNPHSNEPKMMRSTKPLYMNMTARNFGSVFNFKKNGGFQNPTTGSPYYHFCGSPGCHASESGNFNSFDFSNVPPDTYIGDDRNSSHHPVDKGTIVCYGCHNQHGTSINPADNMAPALRAPYYRSRNWLSLYHSYQYFYNGSNYTQINWPPPTVDPPANANDLCLMCHQKDDIIGTAASGMSGTNTHFLGHEAVKGGATISHAISPWVDWRGTDQHNFSCSTCHYSHSSNRMKLLKVGCMGAVDNSDQWQYSGGGGGSALGNCHAYTKWVNWNSPGWRNLTTASKQRFTRPPNTVTDLAATVQPNLWVTLTWTAVADAPGQGAHHYNVYRYSQPVTQDVKPYSTRVAKGVAGGGVGTVITWTDQAVTDNTTYYYTVVACDSEGDESFVGNSVVAAIGGDNTAPGHITDQQVIREDGKTTNKVTWHDPGDNVMVAQYKVYRINGTTPLTAGDIKDANMIGQPVPHTGPNGASDTTLYYAIDTTALVTQSYSYAVIAIDATGNASGLPTGFSFSVSGDTTPPPAISTQQVARTSGSSSVTITVRDPGDADSYVASYKVYRKAGTALLTNADIGPANYLGTINDTSLAKAPDANTYSFTDSTALVTQSYSYAVVAVDAAGWVSSVPTGSSYTVTADSTAPPAITTQQTARVDGTTNIRATWRDPGDADTYVASYKIYRLAGTTALIDSDIIPANYLGSIDDSSWGKVSDGILYGYTDTTAQVGQDYAYAVVAIDAAGNVSHAPTAGTLKVAGDRTAPPAISTQQTARVDGTLNIRLTWRDPGDADTYVTIYNVYRKAGLTPLTDGDITADNYIGTVSDTVWSRAVDGNTYSFNDATAQGTQDYSYAVVAVDAAGLVSHAPTVGTRTVAGDTSASTITTQQATQPDATLNVVLTWRDPGDADTYAASYKVYRTVSAVPMQDSDIIPGNYLATVNDTSFAKTADGNTYTYTNTTAQMGQTYAYAVVTVDAAGNVSHVPTGTTLNITVTDPAPNPVTVNSIAPVTADNKAALTWTAPADIGSISGYNVYAKAGSALTQQDLVPGNRVAGPVAGLSCQAPIPGTGTAYYFSVTAIDESSGKESKVGNSMSLNIPSPPPGLSVVSQPNSQISLSWSAPAYTTNLQNYKVYRRRNGGAWTTVTTTASRTAAIDLAGQEPGAYDFAVSAAYSTYLGITPYESVKSVVSSNIADTVAPAAPGPVTGSLCASSNYDRARISWAAPADLNFTGYTPSGVDHYVVEANYSGSWVTVNGNYVDHGATVTFDDLNALAPAASVTYRVQSVDASGNSSAKTTSAAINARPRAISDLSVSSSSSTSANVVTFGASSSQAGIARYNIYAKEQGTQLSGITGASLIGNITTLAPTETFVHDLQNMSLPAEAGHTYAYAVIAEDTGGIGSSMSGGTSTVNAVQDKDAPDKVNDLTLVSPIGTAKVVLTWTTPQDNKGRGAGTGAVNYEIYRLPVSTVNTPAPVTEENAASASLVASRMYASGTPGTFNNYTATWYDHKMVYYAVRSYDAVGNGSVVSNSPYVTVGKDIQAPSPPVITNCTPVTSPEVDVYWTAATDNVGINGYRLFRADSNSEPFHTDGCINENNIGQAQVAVDLVPYDATSIDEAGGTPGKTYFYALKAWDHENNMSNISNCGIATVGTTATDTTRPAWSGSPLTVTQQQYPDIDLVFTSASDLNDAGGAGAIDHYDVYRSASVFGAVNDPGVTKVATVAGVRNSYVDETGVPGTTYYYGLVAVDASANHNQSVLCNVASATVAERPSPDNVRPTVPAGLTAATGIYPVINLSWTASTDVDDAGDSQPLQYYRLYCASYPASIPDDVDDKSKYPTESSLNAAGVYTILIDNGAASYASRGLADTPYNYRLEAFDLAGNPSGLTGQVTARVAPAPCVDTTPPSPPGNFSAAIGPSPDMELSWTASTDSGSCAGLIDHYLLRKVNYMINSDTDVNTLGPPVYIAGNATTYTDSTGVPNTQYWYVLVAVDSSGNQSGKSAVITSTTAADKMAPAAIADLKAAAQGAAMQLTWCRPSDNVGVDHYDIYRKQQTSILTDADINSANKIASFRNTGACLSYNDSGVTGGLSYSYAVVAVDGAGNRSTISRGRLAGDTVAALP